MREVSSARLGGIEEAGTHIFVRVDEVAVLDRLPEAEIALARLEAEQLEARRTTESLREALAVSLAGRVDRKQRKRTLTLRTSDSLKKILAALVPFSKSSRPTWKYFLMSFLSRTAPVSCVDEQSQR